LKQGPGFVLVLQRRRVRPTPRPLPDEAAQALDAVLTRRRQLLEMLTAERNWASPAPPSPAAFARTSAGSSANWLRWIATSAG